MCYDLHVPLISEAMRASPDGFRRGLLFVICSIRQQLVVVPDQLAQLERGDLEPLFGHKRFAYEYITDHGNAERLWAEVCATNDPVEAITRLCAVPGLGIVKAAFVCQLMGFDVACLDSRNIKREGRNPRAYRSDGEARKNGPAFARKIKRYVAETSGKARFYWDAWCADVAAVYDLTPLQVSELHLHICPLQEVPF